MSEERQEKTANVGKDVGKPAESLKEISERLGLPVRIPEGLTWERFADMRAEYKGAGEWLLADCWTMTLRDDHEELVIEDARAEEPWAGRQPMISDAQKAIRRRIGVAMAEAISKGRLFERGTREEALEAGELSGLVLAQQIVTEELAKADNALDLMETDRNGWRMAAVAGWALFLIFVALTGFLR